MTFLIVSVVGFNLVAFFIPKRLTKIEMYASSFFAFSFALLTDVYLDLKLDWYGYFEKGAQWETLIALLGLYPSANIIILNYFPLQKNLRSKAFYVLGWSAILVLFEWASVKSGYFYHNEWKYRYSALVNPFILIILVWNLKLIRKLNSGN